jgi:TolB protein
MRIVPRTLFLILALCAWRGADAQLVVQVTRGAAQALPIAVVPFGDTAIAGGTDPAAVVAADLERSGLFRTLPRADLLSQPTRAAEVDAAQWRLLKVDYVVVGRLRPTAPGFDIEFELVNVLTGERRLALAMPATTANARMASHRIADAIYEKIVGVRGAFATRIAYVSVEGRAPERRFQLIVADADGANPRIVAQSWQPIMSPAWSPDALQLAYVSFEGNAAAIFVQTLRSGERIRVSARSGINGAPAWSPDGGRLALTLSKRDGNVDVWVLTLATQQLERITDHLAIDTEPVWSADGRSLYFTSDRAGGPQVYRVDAVPGARPERVTFENSYNARARLSPDGRTLAVTTLDRGNYRIATLEPDRAGLRVLSDGRLDESPSYAPNGATIIYATREGGRGVLATVSVDGGVTQRLRAAGADIREPVWSPFLR